MPDMDAFVQELWEQATAEMVRSQAAILALALERGIQRLEFPPEADDALEPAEWIARIAKHLGRAVSNDRVQFRRELVILGALSLAAIESYDRKYGDIREIGPQPCPKCQGIDFPGVTHSAGCPNGEA